MKKLIVGLVVLMALLFTIGYAFDFWSLFRSTTGFSTAIMVPSSVNSYQFEIGDTLSLPTKQVEFLDLRSDNSIEVSVSGSVKKIKLNDYEILNDVKVFYLSKLSKNKVQITIDDFSSADPAKQLADGSYIFVTGSKLVQNGMMVYLSSIGGGTIKLYVDGRKEALSKGESKNLNQLRIGFFGSSLVNGGKTAAKIGIVRAQCIDSDNGEQIYSKGMTTDSFGDVSTDACVTINGGVEKASESCFGPDCYLKEGYCDTRYQDYYVVKSVKCDSGCLRGACESGSVQKSLPESKTTNSQAKVPSSLYIIKNTISEVSIAWKGNAKKYNLYLNKDDGTWEKPVLVSTSGYNLQNPLPNVKYGFYVTALDEYNRESYPSLPRYATASRNVKCTDSDSLETGTKGYVRVGNDFIFDTCVGTKLAEGYCMQDGSYGIKVFGEKGMTCEGGKFKSKPNDDCQLFGCRRGYSCMMTNAIMDSYECIKAPATSV